MDRSEPCCDQTQPGLVSITCGTDADMKAIFIKKDINTHRSIQTEDMTVEHHAGPLGEAPEAIRSQRGEGEAWAKTFIWFPWEGIGEAG